MNAKCLNFFVILISLHVVLKSSSAAITQKDVESCIAEVKKRLENQQSTAKKRFYELKTRKVNDMKDVKDERQENLVAFIQNEKNILSTLKQSAIQDNFNVTLCNDTSAVYDLILNSFKASADAILVDYRGVVERNHTQNSITVDKLATNYRQLEQKLSNCQGQQNMKIMCYDEVEDDCEMTVYKNEIFDLESSYYGDADKSFNGFKMRVISLYDGKLKEVQSFSNEMKTCYKSVENVNGTSSQDNVGDSGVVINPLSFLIVLPVLYKIII